MSGDSSRAVLSVLGVLLSVVCSRATPAACCRICSPAAPFHFWWTWPPGAPRSAASGCTGIWRFVVVTCLVLLLHCCECSHREKKCRKLLFTCSLRSFWPPSWSLLLRCWWWWWWYRYSDGDVSGGVGGDVSVGGAGAGNGVCAGSGVGVGSGAGSGSGNRSRPHSYRLLPR